MQRQYAHDAILLFMTVEGSLNALQHMLRELNLAPEGDEAEEAPILSSPDLAGFVKYIQDHNCKHIIVMSGAGVSTSAGIPDFRTPGSGLYDNLQVCLPA